MKRSIALFAGSLVCSCLILMMSPARALAAEPVTVYVGNWPGMQQVKGSISVDGPVSHIRFLRKESIMVHPSRRGEPTEMAGGGVIEADGFTHLTLSLQGEVKGSSAGAGSVGVLLIPDEGPILRAFREARRMQYAIENTCMLNSGDPIYFNTEQMQQRLSFPRYRVYLYNTTNKTVEANLYLALTN